MLAFVRVVVKIFSCLPPKVIDNKSYYPVQKIMSVKC